MFISKKNFYVKQPPSLKAIIFQIKFLNLKKKKELCMVLNKHLEPGMRDQARKFFLS